MSWRGRRVVAPARRHGLSSRPTSQDFHLRVPPLVWLSPFAGMTGRTMEHELQTLVAPKVQSLQSNTGSYVSGATTNTGTVSPTKSAPPVRLTPKAADEVRKLIKTKNVPEGFGLRVGVRGGGCSGMSYILGFDKQREHDLLFELDDLKLIMDRRHGLYLMGTTVDYHDGLDARGFTFENPNAASSCGCGSSFGV